MSIPEKPNTSGTKKPFRKRQIKQADIDSTRILVRNFPPTFTPVDITDFFVQLFGAQSVQLIGHHTAIAQFANHTNTKEILTLLHQRCINESVLYAEFAHVKTTYRRAPAAAPSHPPPTSQMADDFVAATTNLNNFLSALRSAHDFDHIPPPHLHYRYPKLTRDIMDAICIALETTPKFYTQVLHLMNRMNLEPPFVPGSRNLQYDQPKRTVATQTDPIEECAPLVNRRSLHDLASGESELSSSGADDDGLRPLSTDKRKRRQARPKRNDQPQQKKRILNLIKAEKMKLLENDEELLLRPTAGDTSLRIAFENKANPIDRNSGSIKIVAPDILAAQDVPMEIVEIEGVGVKEPLVNEDLASNRIPSNQLAVHPLFVNYAAGDPSDKLYIKNLAKQTSDEDLLRIYGRYEGAEKVEVKLMQSGRMKGQAFVTFKFSNDIIDEAVMRKAIDDTNGYILNDKPMVVMYGKKSATQK